MKPFLLLIFFFTTQAYSQSASLQELKEMHQELTKKMDVIQDSLASINQKIAEFPIKDVSEPVRAYAIKGAILRKEPTKKGKKITTLEENADIQVIDIYNSFYLVCISGNCGYLQKKDVRRTLPSS